MNYSDYKIHPAADLFPRLEGDAFRELVEDIRANGLRDPITVVGEEDDLTLLDGRNRVRACEEAGVPPHFTPYLGDDPVGFIISKNLRRRDLTPDQRAAIAHDLATMARGGDRRSTEFSNRQSGGSKSVPVTKAEAAKKMGVSKRRVERIATVAKKSPELHAKVKSGNVSLGAAEKELKPRAPRGSRKAERGAKKAAKEKRPEKRIREREARTAEYRGFLADEVATPILAHCGQDQEKLKRILQIFRKDGLPEGFDPASQLAEALFEMSALTGEDEDPEDAGLAERPIQEPAPVVELCEASPQQGDDEAQEHDQEAPEAAAQPEEMLPPRPQQPQPDEMRKRRIAAYERQGVTPALAARLVEISGTTEEKAGWFAELTAEAQDDLAEQPDKLVSDRAKQLARKREAAE